MSNTETLEQRINTVNARKERGAWQPGGCGTEPVMVLGGVRVQYLHQPSTGRSAYFDLDADVEIPDAALPSFGL